MNRSVAALALIAIAMTACDSTGPEDGARIRIQFSTASAPSTASMAMSSGTADLAITGSNGTLELSDIHLIVDKVELEMREGSCDASTDSPPAASASRSDDDEDDDDECEEFEAGPFFVSLALGSEVAVVTQDVPAGTYTRLKFEVEDSEFGEDDDDHHGASLQNLLQDIEAAGFTDWPRKASMAVSGTFTPTDGAPVPFTSYFEAELNIRQRFDPPLIVNDEATTVTIEVDPALWFRDSAGHVMDLSAFDFATTNRVVEFEAKMRDGFHRVEHDHD